MQRNKSIQEMQAEIAQLQAAMLLPGVPDDERAIYQSTINTIRAHIAAMHGPATNTPPSQPISQPIKTTTPPAPPPIVVTTPPPPQTIEEAYDRDADLTNVHYQRQADAVQSTPPIPSGESLPRDIAGQVVALKTRVIHAGNQSPVNSQHPLTATIQADHQTNPYNPTITITWADGYTITVDETAARGRFATTLRDTCALRLVQQGRYQSMWRWSSPWRAAGFYQALTHFRGSPPTLRDLGILRPNEVTTQAFQHITEKAAQSA